MFDQTFVDTQNTARNPWSMAVSLTVQTGVVLLLLLIPLLHPEGPLMKVDAPPIVYRPNTVVQPIPVTQTAPRLAPRAIVTGLFAPRSVPRSITTILDAPEQGLAIGDTSSIIPGAIASDLFSRLPERVQPPPAKPPVVARVVETPPPSTPLRVSTSVQSALLIFGPKPAYPPLAKAARVQGTVRLTAVISTEGIIRDLKLISGPPLLVRTSLEAVGQWRYKPTLLNGSPVEVVTEIDVNFTLGQ